MVRLAVAQQHGAFNQRGRLVGQNVIHLAAKFIQRFGTMRQLCRRGQLVFKPASLLNANVFIRAFAAAANKKRLPL